MFKRDIIKELHNKGVRHADKQGYGRVSLEHMKTSELAAMLYKINHPEQE